MSKPTKKKLPEIQILNPESGALIASVSGDEIIGYDNAVIQIKKAGKTVGLVPFSMVVIWNS